MQIYDYTFDFDFTSPGDMLRYKNAREAVEKATADIPDNAPPLDTPEGFEKYIELLNTGLKIYGDYIDTLFGDGAANKLLGNNPSLTRCLEIREIIDSELEKQGVQLGETIAKYAPNKATE